jgi:hypothetical protein
MGGIPNLAAKLVEVQGGRDSHQVTPDPLLHPAVKEWRKTGIVLLIRPRSGSQPEKAPVAVGEQVWVAGPGHAEPSHEFPAGLHRCLLFSRMGLEREMD